MKNMKKQICTPVAGQLLAMFVILVSIGVTGTGCSDIVEGIDNIDSRIVCGDYCQKKFGCDDYAATDAEKSTCVAACRDSMEDNCGNEHQAAANDKVGECVDKSCADFWACMAFDAAPECFGFVGA